MLNDLMDVKPKIERKHKLGLFCGSFNPFHIGHLDILLKAESILDRVIICQGQNEGKDKNVFSLPEKISDKTVVYNYENIIALYHSFKNIDTDIFFVRGIRNSKDLEYEKEFQFFVTQYIKDAKFLHILSEDNLKYISSSQIRGLKKLGLDVSEFIV